MAVLELEGDYDLARADSLRESVSPMINRGQAMIVDLTRVSLIDSLGVGVLVNAHQRCELRGIPFALVVGPSPDDPVRHSLRLTGVFRLAAGVPLARGGAPADAAARAV